MKKLLIACALMAAMTANAQKPLNNKSQVNKAETAMQESLKDPKNINYEKLAEAEELIAPCMKEGLAKDMPKTWFIAGRIENIKMNKMLTDRVANDGKMDYDAFFENQDKIVKYFSECDRLEHTPDAKGKLPKEEYRPQIQQIAKQCRANLRIAGGQNATKDPEKAIYYINAYKESAGNTIFAGMPDVKPENDPEMPDVAYFLATALRKKGDMDGYAAALQDALKSKQYGKGALGELATYYQQKGDKANALKCFKEGFDKYPDEPIFGRMLMSNQFNAEDYDGCMQTIQKMKAQFPDDDTAYSIEGHINFKNKKYAEARASYLAAYEKNSEATNNLQGAAQAAWMQLSTDNKNKELQQETLELYKKFESVAPDQGSVWGEALYILYTNTQQPNLAKAYKKYYSGK